MLVSRQLTTLVKKYIAFKWECTEENAFETLKEKLVTRPVLAIYDTLLKQKSTRAQVNRAQVQFCYRNKLMAH